MNKIILACTMFTLMACAGGNKQEESSMQQTENVKDVNGRKNFAGQPAVVTPEPVMMIATYDENGVPDAMPAGWASQCDYDKVTVELSSHKTTDNIRLKKAFTVSFATEETMAQSDYLGMVSGSKVPDKVKRAGLTVTHSPNVDAPIINEYKLTLECRVTEIEEHDDGGARVVGQVVNWSADESILTNGKVDLSKLRPLVYDSSYRIYRSVGDSVGTAWKSGEKYK